MLTRPTAGRQIPGVLFAEDFGDDCGEGVEERPNVDVADAIEAVPDLARLVVVGPTDEEIEEGRQAARKEGYEAGLKAAQEGFAAQRTEALSRLDEALAGAVADVHAVVDNGLATLADTLVLMLAECLPALCRRHGVDEMRDTIRSLLPSLADEPQLLIIVHPTSEDILRQELVALKSKPERIKVLADEVMLIGDVTVKWENGSASRDVGRWGNDMIRHLMELNSKSVREETL